MFKSLGFAVLLLAVAVQASPAPAGKEDVTFRIPPRKIPLKISDQPLTVTASGVISLGSRGHDQHVLKLELDADLSDIQHNATDLLRSQLNKQDPCGDRIAIEHATLMPAGSASRAVVQLHYERYACFKVFGNRMTKKLVGGNGVIQMKFTPAVGEGKTLRLMPEVESVQADGPLGELLRSGQVGAMVRDKLSQALLSAMQKGAERSLTLPPAVQDIVTISKAQFQDEGSGRLGIVLQGEYTISPQQIQLLKNQLKERMPAR